MGRRTGTHHGRLPLPPERQDPLFRPNRLHPRAAHALPTGPRVLSLALQVPGRIEYRCVNKQLVPHFDGITYPVVGFNPLPPLFFSTVRLAGLVLLSKMAYHARADIQFGTCSHRIMLNVKYRYTTIEVGHYIYSRIYTLATSELGPRAAHIHEEKKSVRPFNKYMRLYSKWW